MKFGLKGSLQPASSCLAYGDRGEPSQRWSSYADPKKRGGKGEEGGSSEPACRVPLGEKREKVHRFFSNSACRSSGSGHKSPKGVTRRVEEIGTKKKPTTHAGYALEIRSRVKQRMRFDSFAKFSSERGKKRKGGRGEDACLLCSQP